MRKSRIIKSVLLITLAFFFSFYVFRVEATLEQQEFKDVTIYAVVNTSKIESGKPFELLTIIVNPTSFELKNLSFYIIAPPYIGVINATNTSETKTLVKTTVEHVNITVKIESIGRNETFVHRLVLVANSTGDVKFDYSEAHFTKVKGEYQLDAIVTIPDKTVRVYSRIKAPPEEGKINRPEIIILGLIVLPLLSYAISPKILGRKRE